MNTPTTNSKNRTLINILSIAIPLAVSVLIGNRTKFDLGTWTKILPHVICAMNAITSICLILGLIFIKQKNIAAHRICMLIAFGIGALFLITYILYHSSNPNSPFGGSGIIKYTYYFLLISHILLSVGVVRLVLLAVNYAINNQIQEHIKIVKWAYPIWLYVSISGVLVYILIQPYYS